MTLSFMTSRTDKTMIDKIPHYLALMRFDRPIGTLLLLWPTLWSLWLANDGAPAPLVFWVFVLGVFIMRSAGCVINDYADRDIDPLVERTQDRPLAAGHLKAKDALLLFAFLGVVALVLLFCLPSRVWPWAVPAMLVTIIYPFMKRFIQAPQAVLGIAFSFSIPMIYVAADQTFNAAFFLLLGLNFCWVMAYDTAYAMSDREDDLKVGVKSTAILFGQYDRLIIGLLQLVVVILLLVLKAEQNLSDWFLVAIAVVVAMFYHQQGLIAERDRGNCLKAFLNNGWVGAVIFLGLLGG